MKYTEPPDWDNEEYDPNLGELVDYIGGVTPVSNPFLELAIEKVKGQIADAFGGKK